jgi:adenylate cyclase
MRAALLIGLAASLLVLVPLVADWLQPVEMVAVDLMMAARGSQPVDPRIVVCEIDAEGIDTETLGRWPWRRTHVARLIDRLKEGGAKVIALDVVFSEPSLHDPDFDLSGDDRALEESLRRAGNVVLGYFFRRPEQGESSNKESLLLGAGYAQASEPDGPLPVNELAAVEANLPSFADVAAQGFFSHDRERGVLRHFDLATRFEDNYYPPLGLRAAELFAGESLALSAKSGLAVVRLGSRRIEADEAAKLWVNYRGPGKRHQHVSAAKVLAGDVAQGFFKGRLVFVGLSESGLSDFVATPYGQNDLIPGVYVQATVADNVLNGDYIHDTGLLNGVSLLVLFLIGPLVAVLAIRTPRHLVGALAAAVVTLTWPAASYAAFEARGLHLQTVAPVLAGVLALVGALRYRVAKEEARARLIRKTFEHYLAQPVVEEMLRHPEKVNLHAVKRDLTVLFMDIRGFTSVSETLDPAQVVALLNEFFTPMTRIVLEHGGTLDKYMGDCLMAFWGAPIALDDHAARACRATLAMRDELAWLNDQWHKKGRLPEHLSLGIGIGLNSGVMSVGNVGSEDVFGYTVIGDNVNLGSRIEGLNKEYHSQILVSEFTVAQAGDGFLFREIDWVRVKGKQKPVAIYELLCPQPAASREREQADLFAKGLAAYRARELAAAAEIFADLVERFDDGPAQSFGERCLKYQQDPPPADWDGVEVRTTK